MVTLIALLFFCVNLCSAQQWNGSANAGGLITRTGDLSVRESSIARVSLGYALGSLVKGRGYIGFNLRRENDGSWSYLSSMEDNDGIVLYHSKNMLNFSFKASSGSLNGTTMEEAIAKGVAFKINGQNNTATIGRNTGNNIQTVSIGPANPGSVMWGGGYIGFNMERNSGGEWIYQGDGGASNGGFAVYADGGGSLNFSPRKWDDVGHSGDGGSVSDEDVMAKRCFQIHHSGKVIVGNPVDINIFTTKQYGLYVEEGILTEKLRVAVKNTQAWADTVFDPDYNLPSLEQVQKHISEKRHLPGIPSAAEVVKEGIDTGEMTAKLLSKIEELTLYVLQQEAKIKALEQKVAVGSQKKTTK